MKIQRSPLSPPVSNSPNDNASPVELETLLKKSCSENGTVTSTAPNECRPVASNNIVLTPDRSSNMVPLASPDTSIESFANTTFNSISPSCSTQQLVAQIGKMKATRQRVQSLTSTESAIFCRICHQGDTEESLHQMCTCSGTMGLLHKKCMERWLTAAGSDKCEICSFAFQTERVSRSFTEWISGHNNHKERHNILTDGACFMILTPLACVSTWLCITGARYFYAVSDVEKKAHNWETWGLTALTMFLVVVYIIWCIVAVQYHRRVFSSWRKKNQHVRLITTSYKVPSATVIIEPEKNNNNTFNNLQNSGISENVNVNFVCQQCAKEVRSSVSLV